MVGPTICIKCILQQSTKGTSKYNCHQEFQQNLQWLSTISRALVISTGSGAFVFLHRIHVVDDESRCRE